MFTRVLRGGQQGLAPLYARRSLTTLVANRPLGRKGKLGLYIGAALVGTALAVGYAKNDDSSWTSIKENIMTSYESRIRNFSNPEKVFHTFASEWKDGKQFPHQFHYEPKSERKKRARDLPAAFKVADRNNDGLLSFQEYLFFVSLLSIPERSFKVAFKLLDEDGSGKVDQQEFLRVMSLVKKLSPPATLTTTEAGGVAQGWLDHFFRSKDELTFETFSSFLGQLNRDVLKMEYDLYDKEDRGYLSQRDFGFLLVSFANPKDFYDRATELDATPLKPFSFDQFAGFNDLIDHIDDVEMGMRLYQLNNRPFRKQDLQRLTRIVSLYVQSCGFACAEDRAVDINFDGSYVCKTELNQQVIDTIMRIFDKNRDGTLEIDEFVKVIKKRKSRGLAAERGIL